MFLSRALWGPLAALRDTMAQGLAAIRQRGPGQVLFWLIALVIGIASGAATVGLRLSIDWLESHAFGAPGMAHLSSYAARLPWYWLVLVPAAGGFLVGLILNWFTPDARVRSVADVIEAAALREGRVELRAGLGSALASLITLGTGGSAGREGPAVHLASMISTWASARIHASGANARDLLGCAVAAAVSASFNAPIAGTIFALEVVLRHFAIHAFAPIAIASVAGTVVARMRFGDITEFRLGDTGGLAFNVELPAFLLLGLVSGLVAVILMRAVFFADDWASKAQERLHLPRAWRPAIAGALVGTIAIRFPEVLGVGYETTSAALTGALGLREALILAVMKAAAVAITLGGRMGGGIFSPSLVLGSLTGLAFGLVATALFPAVSGSETIYALAGMGAVAAAVLGAPISTSLIMFELTGDWHTGLAVLTAVGLSTALSNRLVDHSFFLTLLERRGLHLAPGPQAWLPETIPVAQVMQRAESPNAAEDEEAWQMVERGQFVEATAMLDRALRLFEQTGAEWLPVVTLGPEGEPAELWGRITHVDALRAFADALARVAAEEHD